MRQTLFITFIGQQLEMFNSLATEPEYTRVACYQQKPEPEYSWFSYIQLLCNENSHTFNIHHGNYLIFPMILYIIFRYNIYINKI